MQKSENSNPPNTSVNPIRVTLSAALVLVEVDALAVDVADPVVVIRTAETPDQPSSLLLFARDGLHANADLAILKNRVIQDRHRKARVVGIVGNWRKNVRRCGRCVVLHDLPS